MFWNKNKNVSTRYSAAPIRSPLALSLEPRMLFDGAVAATVADAATTTADASQTQSADDSSQHATDAVTPPAASSDQRQEIVFVDGKLQDAQQLIAGLPSGTEFVVLDSNKDGLQQIADYLKDRSNVDAIHLLSHGSEGTVELGNTWLNTQNIGQHSQTLNAIGAALAADGDILIYGCNTGEGTQGATLLNELARLTQTDVAASDDATGAASKGGDWLLERQVGEVATASLSLGSYQSLLAAPADQNFNGESPDYLNNAGATIAGVTYSLVAPTAGNGAVMSITEVPGNVSITPGGGDLAVMFNFDGVTVVPGPVDARIASADGAEFRLVSMEIDTGTGLSTSPNLTIKGYLNGVEVASDTINTGVSDSTGSVTYTKNGIPGGFGGTLTFSSAWQYIDEIRITGNNTIVVVDDLNFEAAVLPSVAPVATTSGGTTAFTEGNNVTSTPVVVDSGITLSDSDSASLATGKVSITGNFQSGQDVLSFTNNPATMGNITGSYNSGTGVLSLSSAGATATVAQWQAAMRSVTYTNSSDTPSTSNRTISFVVNDGTGDSNSATKTVSITSVNDAPVTSASGGTTAFTEGNNVSSTPVVVDSGITISDPDNSTLSNAKVIITGNFQTAEDVLAFTNNPATMGNIAASYNASTGELSLTSAGATATLAQWQAALRSVTYTNSSDTPNTSNRTISFVVNDGTSDGNTTTKTVSVASVNDTPIATTSGGTTAFTEGNTVASTPVVIDSGITISDVDSTTLSTATVSITGNLHTGEDVLAFTNNPATMGNITASYNAGTGVMTLTSAGATATLAQWQAALRSVTYTNSSDNPNTSNRTISFVANDGSTSSSAATKIVSVTAVNEAPQVTVPATISVTEDVSSAITGISFSDVDAGSSSVTVTLSVTSGSLAATSGGSVTIGGTSSALTLTGSISNINTFIAGSNVSFTTEANSTADVTLTASINDGGNTGSGGAQSANDVITLQVAAINDAPTITAPGSISTTEDASGALTGISFADVDAGNNNVTVTLSVPSGTLSATSGSGVTVGGTASALTLSGTIADINAFIAASGVSFTTASNASANVTLTVAINDGGNSGSGGAQTDSTTVTLTVTTVNDAPVNSLPAAQSVDQDSSLVFNSGNGNLISISDVDAGANSVEVTLTASNGLLTLSGLTGLSFSTGDGTADSSITFSGSIADINNALNGLIFSPNGGYNGPASLQITSNDLGSSGSGGAQTDTDTLTITVNSLNPRITSVSSSTADGTYKVGDTITITTTFSEAVTVDTTGGIPSLLLETGSIDRIATYVSGSGSNTLTFSYTVQAGDISADLDYPSTAALGLNGATIRGATSNDAVLTLPTMGNAGSLGANKDIAIDGVAATVSSVSVPANGTYVAGQNLDFTVNLSESVIVDTTGGTPRIAITLDTGGTVYANYLSGSGSSALVFRLTVANGQMDSNGISLGGSIDAHGGTLRDAAGNDSITTLNSVGSTTAVLVDAVAPQVNAISLDSASPTNTSSVTFTVTFSEDVSGVDISDFSLVTSGSVNATLQSLTQIDPRTYQVTVDSITGLGNLGLNLNANGTGITDNASNAIASAFTGQAYTIGIPAVTPTPDVTGDPEFRTSDPVTLPNLPNVPLQPQIFGPPTGDIGSPLVFAPLFEQRTLGSSVPPLGNIFISNGALAPSFIAQVFTSSDSGGNGSGAGFLGFGGGDGGVFGSSTLSGIFGKESAPEAGQLKVFDGKTWGSSDTSQGLRGVFGAPTLSQQLHDLHQAEQRQVRELAQALGQFENTTPQA